MGCCVLPGAPSVAGLVEVRCSLWSVLKIEVGTTTEGKRRGLLWEQGGDSWPPSSSCQVLCEEVPQSPRIQVWVGPGASALPPPPSTPGGSRAGTGL